MNTTDKKRQRALLLQYAGEEVNEIFDALADTGEDYAAAKTKLTGYFRPKKYTEYESKVLTKIYKDIISV